MHKTDRGLQVGIIIIRISTRIRVVQRGSRRGGINGFAVVIVVGIFAVVRFGSSWRIMMIMFLMFSFGRYCF